MRDDKVTLDECVRAECISPKTGVVVITIRLFSLSLSAITFLTGLYCRHSVTFVCVFFIEGFGKLSLPERFSLDEKKQTRITNWGYRGRRRFCRYPERKRPPCSAKGSALVNKTSLKLQYTYQQVCAVRLNCCCSHLCLPLYPARVSVGGSFLFRGSSRRNLSPPPQYIVLDAYSYCLYITCFFIKRSTNRQSHLYIYRIYVLATFHKGVFCHSSYSSNRPEK